MTLTRYDRLHLALVKAGPEGLHWRTLRELGGHRTWLRHLDDLAAAGAVLARDKPAADKPLAHGFWRVRLLADVPEPVEPVEEAPETDPLFSVPGPAPLSAVTGERVEEASRATGPRTGNPAVPVAPPALVDTDLVIDGLLALDDTAGHGSHALLALAGVAEGAGQAVTMIHPKTFTAYEEIVAELRAVAPVVIEPLMAGDRMIQIATCSVDGLSVRVFAPNESLVTA